jgi:hypothetical protein
MGEHATSDYLPSPLVCTVQSKWKEEGAGHQSGQVGWASVEGRATHHIVLLRLWLAHDGGKGQVGEVRHGWSRMSKYICLYMFSFAHIGYLKSLPLCLPLTVMNLYLGQSQCPESQESSRYLSYKLRKAKGKAGPDQTAENNACEGIE